MTQVFQPGAVLHAAELNDAYAGKADLDRVTGKVRADQLPDFTQIVSEQTAAEIAALQAAMAGRASQADLAALAALVAGKAGQAALDALAALVAGKASSADLAALASALSGKASAADLAALASAVSGKASVSALDALAAAVAAMASGASSRTPPLAARFTKTVRLGESDTTSVSLGGPSVARDTPGGLLLDVQSRTNDVWPIRFWGEDVPAGPHELIAEFALPGNVDPFVAFGVGWYCEPSGSALIARPFIGRGPYEVTAEAIVASGLGETGGANWTQAGRRLVMPSSSYRVHVILDADGTATSFYYPGGTSAARVMLHQWSIGDSLGASGRVPTHIGLFANGLQEGVPLNRQYSLVRDYSLRPYTGPSSPTAWP